MSDEYEDDLYDPYENRGSGNAAPVVSWKFAQKGDKFTGILLPPKPLTLPGKGHEVRREYKQANAKENQAAGYTVWPPKNNADKINRPVVESEFATRWPNEDLDKARKVSQVHFTFETNLKDGTLLSNKFKERCEEADPKVDPKTITKRRVIEQGKDLTEKIAAALKKVGGKPLPGQTWTVGIENRVDNDYGGETTIYFVDIKPPTDETRAVVQAYVDAARAEADEAESVAAGDKYAGPAEDAPSQEEPPF